MKIAFFEIEAWEKRYLRNNLKNHDLTFFNGILTAENLIEIKKIEVLSTFIYSNIDKPVLDRLPALRLITTRSTGFDQIDIDECRRRNIIVSNVPSYGENTVAEHTFGLILSLSRNLYQAFFKRMTGDFSEQGLRGFDLKGKTLGIVGTGRIGLHVIRIARGFGMKVLAYDVKPNGILSEVLGFTYVPLDEVLKSSKIISLHVPYNEHTHHLINRHSFELMCKGTLLINTARGAVVDTEALVEALENGILAGAGLDVLEGEELIREERVLYSAVNREEVMSTIGRNELLLRRKDVVYTPHIAFFSQEAQERILETTTRNIQAFEEGKPENVVSPAPAPSRKRTPVSV
jgi:D-lactate dehydrogenase